MVNILVMKPIHSINISAIVTSLLLIVGCDQNNHGRIDQLDLSLSAPQPVEVTKVVPTSGGAKIWVKIPDDNTIKGVVATYNRGGSEVKAKISRYVDSLAVEGFSDTDTKEVSISSFNVNEDTSEPVKITFNPLPPAISTVNPIISATAGGVKIKIQGNESKSDLAVCLLRDADVSNANKPVSQIKWKEVTTLFTSSNDITLTRRGLEPQPAVYGVYIRDHWGNMTDTTKIVLCPLVEVMIPKSTFSYNKEAVYALDDNIWEFEEERSNYPVKGLWNGSGASAVYNFLAVDKVPIPVWVTIDLGCVVSLSRIATLPRIAYPQLYGDAHIRLFEFWGSMNPSGEVGPGEHGFDNSWFCLGKFEQQKPSGYMEDGSVGTITVEDVDAFNAGNDFELNSDLYPDAFQPFRYLRLVLTSFASYSMPDATTGAIQFGEITLYGEVIE